MPVAQQPGQVSGSVAPTSAVRPIADLPRQALIIAARTWKHSWRQPGAIGFALAQPVVFYLVLLFVFGGAIQAGGDTYRDFAVPGVLVATLVFDANLSAIGFHADLSSGAIDRLRALPIHRTAPILGHVLFDLSRAMIVNVLMIAVCCATGFRFRGGLLSTLLAVMLPWFFAISLTLAGTTLALILPSLQAVRAAVFTGSLSLAAMSSAYAPTQTMPDNVRAIAGNNPVTIIADAVRHLSSGAEHPPAGGAGAVRSALLVSGGLALIFSVTMWRLGGRRK